MVKALIGFYRLFSTVWLLGLHLAYLAIFFGASSKELYGFELKLAWFIFGFLWVSSLLAPSLRPPSPFFERLEEITEPVFNIIYKVGAFILIIPVFFSLFFLFWYGMALMNSPMGFIVSEYFPGTLAAILMGLFYFILFKFAPKDVEPSDFAKMNTMSGE